MTIENENKMETEVADIEVEVTESETQNEEVAEPSSDDELEKYTKKVSKRINKLNARNRAAEEKAARLEEQLAQKNQQVQEYYNAAVTYQQNLLEKEEETVQIKEREATELYKKAHASGDADLISKADSLKNEVAIQKEKYSEIWQGAPKPEVLTVRYPFAECYTGEEPKVVWQDRLAQMKEEIAKQDFDFATLGCGAMGLPLCKFIQNELGKGCIYLGGGNQLLFGIKGKRWEEKNFFKELMKNPAWIRPLPNETPEGQTEGGAYF